MYINTWFFQDFMAWLGSQVWAPKEEINQGSDGERTYYPLSGIHMGEWRAPKHQLPINSKQNPGTSATRDHQLLSIN